MPDTWWVATNEGIFRSLDNAVTFTKMTASGLPSSGTGRTELAVAPSDGTVYALFSSPTSLWRTTDGGATWSQRTSGSSACDGQCFYNMVLRVDPNDRDTVYRGTIRIFKSTDGGSSWDALTSGWGSAQAVHQDTHVLALHPTVSGTFWVGSDGGAWKSTDAGATFDDKNGNMNTTQFYDIGVRANDPNVICGGAQDNSSLVRVNDNTWSLQQVTGDGFVCGFDPLDDNIAYITSYPSGGYPNLWRSTNGLFGGIRGYLGLRQWHRIRRPCRLGHAVDDRPVEPGDALHRNPAPLSLGQPR